MAASDGTPTRAASTMAPNTATADPVSSTVASPDSSRSVGERTDIPVSERRDEMLFGDDVPTEEGGVVTMAGWSLVAAAFVLLALSVTVATVIRRHRTREPVLDIVDRTVRPAVGRVVDVGRGEAADIRRRVRWGARRMVGATDV